MPAPLLRDRGEQNCIWRTLHWFQKKKKSAFYHGAAHIVRLLSTEIRLFLCWPSGTNFSDWSYCEENVVAKWANHWLSFHFPSMLLSPLHQVEMSSPPPPGTEDKCVSDAFSPLAQSSRTFPHFLTTKCYQVTSLLFKIMPQHYSPVFVQDSREWSSSNALPTACSLTYWTNSFPVITKYHIYVWHPEWSQPKRAAWPHVCTHLFTLVGTRNGQTAEQPSTYSTHSMF